MTYTSVEKLKLIKNKFNKWHYKFNLGDGIVPRTMYPNNSEWHEGRKKLICGVIGDFFSDLSGKRCLDLACNAGFWSFELASLGADKVLGIDISQYFIDQAEFVRDCTDQNGEYSSIEFRQSNIFSLDNIGKFDLVLALGIAYHVTNIIDLFRRIRRFSSGVVVVDSMVSLLPGSILELSDHTRFSGCVPGEFSFVPSLGMLVDVMSHVGFRNMFRVEPTIHVPEAYRRGERVVLVGR